MVVVPAPPSAGRVAGGGGPPAQVELQPSSCVRHLGFAPCPCWHAAQFLLHPGGPGRHHSHFAVYNSFSFLFKFIPRYFIPLDAIIHGIVFLMSILGYSLPVFGDTADVCVLTLYPATLLNSFISPISFHVDSLGALLLFYFVSLNSALF